MFPEHVERSFLDPEYSFAEYFQLGSRRNIRPIKNGLYVCGFVWSHMVHGCVVYTERAETAAVSCGTSHVSAVKYTASVDIQKRAIES